MAYQDPIFTNVLDIFIKIVSAFQHKFSEKEKKNSPSTCYTFLRHLSQLMVKVSFRIYLTLSL